MSKRIIMIIITLSCLYAMVGCVDEEMPTNLSQPVKDNVIDRVELDLNRDRIVDKVELINENDQILLNINKSKILIENSYVKGPANVSIKDVFEMDEIGASDRTLIGVTRWSYDKEDRKLDYIYVYEYKDDKINLVTDIKGVDYNLKISNISSKDMSYIFELYNLHEAYKKELNQFQINFIKDNLIDNDEISNIEYSKINASFHNTVTDIMIKDFNNDGNDDIILVSNTNVKDEYKSIVDEKVFFINLMSRNKIKAIKFVSQSDVIKDSILGKYYLTDRLIKIREEVFTSASGKNKYRVDYYSKSDGKDNNLYDELVIYRLDGTEATMIFNFRDVKMSHKSSGLYIPAIDIRNNIRIDDFNGDGRDEMSITVVDKANYKNNLILEQIDNVWHDVYIGYFKDTVKYLDIDSDGKMELISDFLGGGGYAKWWIGLEQVNVLEHGEYRYSRELTIQYLENKIKQYEINFYKNRDTESFVELVNAYAVMGKTDECKEMISYFSSMTRDKEVDFSKYNDSSFQNFYNFILYRSELYKTQIWNFN